MQSNKNNEGYFSEVQIDGDIIGSHTALESNYRFIKLKDGRILMKEEKLELVNFDLTSGFLVSEMQEYCFNLVDYLSQIKDLEEELGVNLTRHYNKLARSMTFLYPLSKSGGKAANTVKSHYQIAQQYSLNEQKESGQKKQSKASSFFSSLPKPNIKLMGDNNI